MTSTPTSAVSTTPSPTEGTTQPITSPTDPTKTPTTTDPAASTTTEGKPAESAAKTEPVTLDSLTVPEGFDKNDPAAKEFLDIINSGEKDSPQKLIDLYVKLQEQNQQFWLDTNAKWQEELRADPKYGGDKLDPGLANVSKLISEFSAGHGGKDVEQALRGAFDETGAGNHPHIVKFLIWTANQLSEGAPLSGRPAGGAEVSRAQKLFGT